MGRDADDVDFLEPLLEEDLDLHLDSVPDQDSRLNEVVATLTNGAPWTTGGEITPSTPDPNALRCEGHLDVESLRTSNSRSAELRAP